VRPLDGKCALVTGSVRGLGLAIAERLAADGANVVLNGFDAAAGITALQQGLADRHGVRAQYSGADLRSQSDIDGMMTEACAAFGAVDILVNNAVVRQAAPVEAFDAARWDESLAVNLSAAFHTTRLAVPKMKQRGWGRIVNVSSIYGLRGAVDRVGYVVTKTALVGLTRAVALETAAHGVTCNAVCPGTTDTPVHLATIEAAMAAGGITREQAERQVLAGKQPSGRLVSADGVAALVAFLCGPDARDITGAVLPVDGGWSAG